MIRRIMMTALCLVGLSAVAQAADFKIKNGTPGDYDHIFIAPHGTTQWGHDLAEGKPPKSLDGGKVLVASGITPGVYDVKLTDDDDALNICLIPNVSFSGDSVELTAPTGKCQGHG